MILDRLVRILSRQQNCWVHVTSCACNIEDRLKFAVCSQEPKTGEGGGGKSINTTAGLLKAFKYESWGWVVVLGVVPC